MGLLEDFFFTGIKPALLVKSARWQRLKETLDISVVNRVQKIDFPHRDLVLLFLSQTLYTSFYSSGLIQLNVRGTTVLDYDHEALGLALGYPPLACKYFVSLKQACIAGENKVVLGSRRVSWLFLTFVTSIDFLDSDLLWLHQRYSDLLLNRYKAVKPSVSSTARPVKPEVSSIRGGF